MIIKKTVYIQATKYSFENEFSISAYFHKCKTSRDEVVIDICESSFEIEIPDIDEGKLTELHIEELQKSRVKILAENQIRLDRIDDEISKLLCIESKA